MEIVEPGLLEKWHSILLRHLLHMYLMQIDCPWIKVNLGYRGEWDLTIRKYFILGYAFNCFLHMKTCSFKPLSISDSHLVSLDKWVHPHSGTKLQIRVQCRHMAVFLLVHLSSVRTSTCLGPEKNICLPFCEVFGTHTMISGLLSWRS